MPPNATDAQIIEHLQATGVARVHTRQSKRDLDAAEEAAKRFVEQVAPEATASAALDAGMAAAAPPAAGGDARAATIARARACGVPENRLEKVADEAEKGENWARAATIFFSEAAIDRWRLAEHLIFNTDLSPEAAVMVLRGAPVEEARGARGAQAPGPRTHIFYSTAEFDEAKRRGDVRPGDKVVFIKKGLQPMSL